VHFRKAKNRGRVGQRSNGRGPHMLRRAEKRPLKRFMPVARGTRPAYRNKTRGVLVFGDRQEHSPAATRGDLYTCIRRDWHSYRRLPQTTLDPTTGPAFENDDQSGEPEFRGFAPGQRRSCRAAASRPEMFPQILARRDPDVFRNPIDLDFAGASADIDHMFGHESDPQSTMPNPH
jgi:hypothetical protein